MYEIVINETGRNTLKEEPSFFNLLTKKVKTKKEIKDFIIDRYNKLPKIRENNKIFIDNIKTNNAQEVGFLFSYWNKDCSHNSKSWYQTDWIEIREINYKPILLKEL